MSLSRVERDLLHLRFKPRHENFRGCSECPAFDLFDWVIWRPNAKCFQRFKKLRPSIVLCLAHPKSLKVLCRLRFLLKDATLVVAGADTRLSQVLDQIELLAQHCKNVYFEAKDIQHEKIQSFSMGFNGFYLKRFGVETIEVLRSEINSVEWKKEGVLVAWGAIHKRLDDLIPDRRDASDFVASSDWLDREDLDSEEYIKKLAASRYLLAPAGNGIQAPKLAEAWLMHAVPIVVKNPCFEDLSEMGYPFVFLDHWHQLSPVILEDYEAKRLSIDWSRVEKMLTLDHFNEKILGACN